ncbi:MAG: hypothetical protein QHG99_01315 [Methanomicrobiales archaeon]|nr:hypothetical protein [Methanomicrobiales archaeon]
MAVIDFIEGGGEEFFQAAILEGFEGVMAKRMDSAYRPGIRSRDWIKVKKEIELDLVIGGITRGGGFREDTFRALLLGAYRGDELVYVGKVGTGFSREQLRELRRSLHVRRDPPFATSPAMKAVTWVDPEMAARVKILNITEDGRLRAPVFKGLREDKPPRECTYEQIEETRMR